MLSRIPAIISIHNNNNCKIVIHNCALYDITLEWNDVIGLMDTETDELISLEDSVISSILSDIDTKLPKVPKKKLSKDDIAVKAHLTVPSEFKQ